MKVDRREFSEILAGAAGVLVEGASLGGDGKPRPDAPAASRDALAWCLSGRRSFKSAASAWHRHERRQPAVEPTRMGWQRFEALIKHAGSAGCGIFLTQFVRRNVAHARAHTIGHRARLRCLY